MPANTEGWWYEGCGIYRHVWLIKTDRLHVATVWNLCYNSFSYRLKKLQLRIKTTLKKRIQSKLKTLHLFQKLLTIRESCWIQKHLHGAIEPFSQIEIFQKGSIQKPLLWSPETPNLYKVLTEVFRKRKCC